MEMTASISLRAVQDEDLLTIRIWLYGERVRKWFTDPEEWLREIRERHGEFSFISHFIASIDGTPFAFCQLYPCAPAGEKEFIMYPREGTYSIDYMIGEDIFVGRGFGKSIVTALVNRVFSMPDACLVVVKPDADNAPSRATLESCGFTLDPETGVHRLARDDFAHNNPW